MKRLTKFGLVLVLIFITSASSAQQITKWKITNLEQYIQQSNKPTVVNFWATFCVPCIGEIPYFQQLVKKYNAAGVQLLLVSLDLPETYPDKLKAFAVKRNFTAPIVFLDETNADIFCPWVDKDWSGAIPASLFINNKTGYRKFFEAELSSEKFEKEIKAMLADSKK